MRGYSQNVIENNKKAKDTTGTLLGQLCIAIKYPVGQVAKELNVSRQTVYDWFSGITKPSRHMEPKVMELVNKLRPK
jgi:predicted transcriptional regulator YheO